VKKLVNNPDHATQDALTGFGQIYADRITVHGNDSDDEPTYIVSNQAPRRGKVALVSGGGSGHEPLHGGFIGTGMLDAAVPGAMFTSPTPDQVEAAIKAVDGGAGVLLIIKNYTGDVLNFEMASELAEADGIDVASVVVNDDVAVENSLYTAGRRGVAGTVLVEKIAGALAEQGASLDEVKAVAEKVNDNVRSMGVALSACTVPHAGKPSFDLGENEIEIGIGIHGEPGRHRIPMASAAEITKQLVDPIVADLGLKAGDEVLLFINGMGGTPLSEQYIVYAEARKLLEAAGVKVERSLVGDYVTSLEMQGVSVTVLKLDDQLRKLWDAPVDAIALHW